MPFNPNSEQDMQRLETAIETSFDKLKPFRMRHQEAMKEYVGSYYGHQNTKPNHLNLLEVAVNIYMAQLISNPPKVLCDSPDMKVRPTSKKVEALLNARLRENLSIFHSMQRCVRSSLFSMGLMKIGLVDAGVEEMEGHQFHFQDPYMRPVLIDDWVQDMSARTWEEIRYMGNRYQVDYEWAMDNDVFDAKGKEKLQKLHQDAYNKTGEKRLHTLQQSGRYSSDSAPENYYDLTELWDIYLPRERMMLTVPCTMVKYPLRVMEFEGPDHGPFRQLRYNDVDGNAMPLPPAMVWLGLHKASNENLRKLIRQSQRQKTVSVCRGKDSADATRINQVPDGESIALDNPEAVKEVSYGGINQQNFGFFLQLIELFKWDAGGLDTLGGLGAGARTFGQEQLLSANASQRVSQMRTEVHRFVQGCLEDYAYYVYSDPISVYPVVIEGNNNYRIMDKLTPSQRSHEFFEHNIMVDAYSMAYRSPGDRLNTIMQIFGQFIPIAQMMAAQGTEIDFRELFTLIAQYADLPEIKRVFKYSQTEPESISPTSQTAPSNGRPPAQEGGTGRQPGESTQATILGLMNDRGARSA